MALDHFMAIGNTRPTPALYIYYSGEPILVSLSVGCQRIFQLFDSVLVLKGGELAFYLYKRAIIGIIKHTYKVHRA